MRCRSFARTISNKTAAIWSALPVLFGAQSAKLVAADEAIDDGLNVVQRASQTSAGQALNALAVRFSAGTDRLAQLVRQDQDLAGEAAALDKALIAAMSQEPAKHDAAAEQETRDRIAAVAKQRDDLQAVFAKEFPDYAALSNPQPMTAKDVQGLLADDEALVIIELGSHSYVWAITRNAVDWKDLGTSADDVAKSVATLRTGLDPTNFRPFDPALSSRPYRQLLGPVEPIIAGKPRLSLVVNGALTSLPPQVLVTSDPAGKALKDVDWLIRSHAVTVLPSVESLRVLRGKSAVVAAASPLVGFADPILKPIRHNCRRTLVLRRTLRSRAARAVRSPTSRRCALVCRNCRKPPTNSNRWPRASRPTPPISLSAPMRPRRGSSNPNSTIFASSISRPTGFSPATSPNMPSSMPSRRWF